MRFSLFFTLGYNVFGLGLIADWTENDASFEFQFGPFNIWAASDWGLNVTFLGRKIFSR